MAAQLPAYVRSPTFPLKFVNASWWCCPEVAAPVKLAKWIPPPSETNFAGAFLTGELADLHAARDAFIEAVGEVAKTPLMASRRPERLRR